MFDPMVRRWVDAPLQRGAKLLVRLGLSANAVTLMGFAVGMLGCGAIVYQQFEWALALILANRLADGLDGAVARQAPASDLGGYLDIVLDLIFYSGVPFAFALAEPDYALPAAFLIYSFIGTGGSFLAFAVLAAQRGMTTDRRGQKAFYYAAGLMEGTETIVFFVLFCLLPSDFAVLAYLFGSLCWLTTAARIGVAVQTFTVPRLPNGSSKATISDRTLDSASE